MFVDPQKLTAPGSIKLYDIPVNQYNKTVRDELENFTQEELIRLYHDMSVLRKFEEMLDGIKKAGTYSGVSYQYGGPAHLAIGQEAEAVGQAFLLDKDDFIFGSHRSHEEIIAKGLSCIAKMTDTELLAIMEGYEDGKLLRILKKNIATEDVKTLATYYLLYGILAEIFGREVGFNKGLGGSMHTFFIPFGIFPNNAIVGGSADIAGGAALYKKINRKPGITIANIGDGSCSCGPVWEAMNMAAMEQYHTLWDEELRGGLPVLFHVSDNSYAVGDQPAGETMGHQMLARIGAAVNPQQMHAERVNGYDVLAVIDAYRRKLPLLRSGEGPVLLDVVTYRYSGHSPSDAGAYRTREELDAWKAMDSLLVYGNQLIEAGICTEAQLMDIQKQCDDMVVEILKLTIDDEKTPSLDLCTHPEQLENVMFSNLRKEALDDRSCESVLPQNENPRITAIAKKARYGFDQNGTKLSPNKTLQLREALFESLLEGFYRDPTLITYGECSRDWGGTFAVNRGLMEAMPYHRVFNAPISEAAHVGYAVGYAMAGGRSVIELMYCDFLGRAGDEVFNQLAKWQAMSAGYLKMPVVLRVSIGAKYGAQHSQDWTAMFAHVPGLKVVYPVTPYDCKGLMNTALIGTDPVIFLENQKIYDIGEQFHKEGVPEGYYEIPFGEPDIKRAGKDITILTIGPSLYKAMEAADVLSAEYGIEAEVIDARSIVPFNYEPVLESVHKTGRIVIVGEACARGSIMSEIAAQITTMAFDDLDAPPAVIGSRNWIAPLGSQEAAYYPQVDTILDAIHELIVPLAGRENKANFATKETIRRNKLGV